MQTDLLLYWSSKLSKVSSDLSYTMISKGIQSEDYEDLLNEITMISRTIALLANTKE